MQSQQEQNSAMNQSQFLEITFNSLKVREKFSQTFWGQLFEAWLALTVG